MSSSSVPPEEQAKVKPFDPLVLDRTVIAIPLLNDMQADFERIRFIKERYPDVVRQFNAAIEYNPDYPGGEQAAHALGGEMLKKAAARALEASERRLAQIRDAARSTQEDGSRALKIQEDRHRALQEAIDTQTIGPFLPGTPYRFAQLHAAVIRRLLADNERLSSSAAQRPIARIHPTRFEIIIDLNLEHPQGREAARQWVIENIERAKELAEIRDAGQEVHLEKDQRNSQYVFARLEARAIQKLVELDMEAANVEAGKCRALAGNPAIKAQIDASRYRAIFHIWPDFEISAYINKSIATVKANAAQNAFSASGAGITWAVMDSGINSEHRHFATYANIDKNSPLHQSPSPGCRADRRVRQVSMPLPMRDRARRWTKSWSE